MSKRSNPKNFSNLLRRPATGKSGGVTIQALQKVTESFSQNILTTGAAVGSITLAAIDPAGLLLATRLTGYRALADEVRIDEVQFHLKPVYGSSSSGRCCMYIERDPTAAIVASVSLAQDQREQRSFALYEPASITWRPQEPADYEFNLLNPGTTSLGSVFLVADTMQVPAGTNLPNGTIMYTLTITVKMVIRGRP